MAAPPPFLITIPPPSLEIMVPLIGSANSPNLKLQNVSDQHVAFKIRTNYSSTFSVRPSTGNILPNAMVDIIISLQNPDKYQSDCNYKFQILAFQYTDLIPDWNTPPTLNIKLNASIELGSPPALATLSSTNLDDTDQLMDKKKMYNELSKQVQVTQDDITSIREQIGKVESRLKFAYISLEQVEARVGKTIIGKQHILLAYLAGILLYFITKSLFLYLPGFRLKMLRWPNHV